MATEARGLSMHYLLLTDYRAGRRKWRYRKRFMPLHLMLTSRRFRARAWRARDEL